MGGGSEIGALVVGPQLAPGTGAGAPVVSVAGALVGLESDPAAGLPKFANKLLPGVGAVAAGAALVLVLAPVALLAGAETFGANRLPPVPLAGAVGAEVGAPPNENGVGGTAPPAPWTAGLSLLSVLKPVNDGA